MHLSQEGLEKLVAIKATINKGNLSADMKNQNIDGVDGKLTKAFPLVKAVSRPLRIEQLRILVDLQVLLVLKEVFLFRFKGNMPY